MLNDIRSFLGMSPIDVYTILPIWPLILTIVNVWLGIGMGSMLYFAALMGIDSTLYEAAQIDGASHWQQTRYISIPHLVPIFCPVSYTHLDVYKRQVWCLPTSPLGNSPAES